MPSVPKYLRAICDSSPRESSPPFERCVTLISHMWRQKFHNSLLDVNPARRRCPDLARRLDVEPQQVVPIQCEAADGRLGADAAMRSVPIVAMKPSRQFCWAFVCASL